MTVEITLKSLLEAGAHFGHQTYKWNPKMKKYVYGERNGIYIIDVAQTVEMAKKAYDAVKRVASSGRPVLFVGTKRQASPIVATVARSCGAFYVTHRWLGGMLTNYKTIALSIDKIRKVEKMKENGDFALLTKKERSKIDKEVIKLEKNLGGIKNMRKLPGIIYLIDPNIENIVVKEATTLSIPVVALADTNCDPTGIEYLIPGNDDSIKSISLFTEYIANSVVEGSQAAMKTRPEDRDAMARDIALEKEILSKFDDDVDLQFEDEEDASYGDQEAEEE
ncbi:MAG: 30S ribosomal protein S2 [Oligoflexia bacterium]|nr:30S ribosomal protein S2 [Oligoflexia bacterium]MBF0364407.1 30S ribosomal protein S2 [Oligoflexia bacterium]